jgi:hypothetical protein
MGASPRDDEVLEAVSSSCLADEDAVGIGWSRDLEGPARSDMVKESLPASVLRLQGGVGSGSRRDNADVPD